MARQTLNTDAQIPRAIASRLLDHARSETGKEVCGLVAARDGVPVSAIPIPNVAADPRHRYRMDPAALIDQLYRIEQAGQSLFAIYHSHPFGPAAPSATDIREAEWPAALYLIISLNRKGVLEMRGFRIRDGESTEVALIIE